jgi:hypothetical protein
MNTRADELVALTSALPEDQQENGALHLLHNCPGEL